MANKYESGIRKNKHKGFTLIELIVAFAILAVATTAIGGFMISGIRSYQKAHAQTKVQKEAQIAMNQIQSMIIDAGLGVDYNIIGEDGSNNFVTKDTIDGKYKVLYVFNFDQTTNKVKALLVGYVADEKRIYYTEIADIAANGSGYDSDGLPTGNILGLVNGPSISNWDLLAENVENFSMDLTQYSTSKKVNVTLNIKTINSEYANNCDITLRNDVLINVTDIKEIYQKNSKVIETIYREIQLSSSKSTTKGGSITINSKVIAESGYAVQTIYRWVVTSVSYDGTETIVYDSNSDSYKNSKIKIDENKTLSVSYDATVTNIKVYAYVDGNNHYSDEAYENKRVIYINKYGKDVVAQKTTTEQQKLLKSDGLAIAIKDVSSFTLQATADLNLDANETLRNEKLANDWTKKASYDFKTGAVKEGGEIDVFPGNIISFIAEVSGHNLVDEEGDKKTKFAVVIPEGSKVEADISDTGVLNISRYSQAGTFYVTCYPQINNSATLTWKVNVGLLYAEGENNLKILTNTTTIYRGDDLKLGLSINDNKIDEEELTDFAWTITPVTTGITGNPVSVTNDGVVSASLDLAYDYTYQVLVTAALKSNNDIKNSVLITVPRVSLSIDKPTYASKLGTTINTGEINVTVIGIVDGQYGINWDMATQTNPSYYSTWTPNKSYIDGYGNTCKVVLSGGEPSSLSYMKVRATLDGYSNYNVTSLILLEEASIQISKNTSSESFDRGQTVGYKVDELIPTNLSYSEIVWTVSATDSKGNNISTDGFGISKNTTGCNISIPNNFYFTNDQIKVTVKAEVAGIWTTDDFYINPVEFKMTGSTSVNRGETMTFTVNNNYGYGIDWSSSANDLIKVSSTENSITYRLPVNHNTSNSSETISIVATLNGQSNMVSTCDVKVNQVSLKLSSDYKNENGSYKTYEYSTSVNGIDGDYSIAYSLSTNGYNGFASSLDSNRITVNGDNNGVKIIHNNSSLTEFYVRAVVTVKDNKGNTVEITNTVVVEKVTVKVITLDNYSTISKNNYWNKGAITGSEVYVDYSASFIWGTEYMYLITPTIKTNNGIKYIGLYTAKVDWRATYNSKVGPYYLAYDGYNWYVINSTNPNGSIIKTTDTAKSILQMSSTDKSLLEILNALNSISSNNERINIK